MDEKKEERRANRPHKIPMEYLKAVANRIHTQQPSEEIILNTLVGVYSTAYPNGYGRHISDALFFRQKRAKAIDDAFNGLLDELDDMIHEKSNQPTKA